LRGSGISIGQLSRATGIHIETIRYYERIGLLPNPPRSRGGHRAFDENHLKRLTFIARARDLGFPLREIRALLSLAERDSFTCDEMRDLTLDHLASIRAKIDDLERLEATLEEVSSKCRGGSTPECPILDALYEQADIGG